MANASQASSTEINLDPASDQTASAAALIDWSERYHVSLSRLENRTAEFPTLQSFSLSKTNAGDWLIFGGRTNGRHRFIDTDDGTLNFPPAYQNQEVWVYDPYTDRSWSKSWSDSGLSQDVQLSLSTTNGQDFQNGRTLFYVGGYVYDRGTNTFETRNRLTAIDIDSVANWVKGENQLLPKNAVLSIAGNPLEVNGNETNFFAVTGGEILGGRKRNQAQLIFGQDFQGGYGNINLSTQIYTSQVRNFTVNYNKKRGRLSYEEENVSIPDRSKFLRRDLNIVNQLSKNKLGSLQRYGVALGGVFYNGDISDGGVWTVPAEIDLLTGIPIMADPNSPSTFRQGFNAYSAANLGLYSKKENSQVNLIFGGISALTLDPSNQPFYNYNNPYPFTSQIAALKNYNDGNWTASLLGSFPEVPNHDSLSMTFGANSTFIPINKKSDKRLDYLADGVLNLDRMSKKVKPGESVLLGYVVGGIANEVNNDFSNPDAYGSTVSTRASGEIFKVIYTAL